MKLHFQTFGSGKPVLILHGLFGSLENWHTISTRLARQKFQVIALDLRNHGRSPRNPEMSYEAMARDVNELLEQESFDQVSLIGHSIGGKVAMEFALLHPGKVAKLVVVDIAPRAYAPSHDRIFQALLNLDLKAFKGRREIETALASAIPDLSVRQFLLKSLKRDEQGAFHWQINLPVLQAAYAELRSALRTGRICDRPALFLRGEDSDYIRPEDESLIHRLFPRAEIRTLTNADHWVHADVPETFLRNVQEFLGD